MKHLTSLALGVLFALSACTQRGAQRTAPAVAAPRASAPSALTYTVRSGSDRSPLAAVRWSSHGAFVESGQAVIHLEARIQNTGRQVVWLQLDQLRLSALTPDGKPLAQVAPQRVESPTRSVMVPPGETLTTQLRFVMPAQVDPGRIGVMRLGWVLVRQNGDRYVQRTDFRHLPTGVESRGLATYVPLPVQGG